MNARSLVTCLCLSVAPAVQADTLLHRQSPGRTFGITSDTLYTDDGDHTNGAILADKFTLPQNSDLCRVNVFGFYGGTGVEDPSPPLSETMRIRLFADSAGLPSEPAFYDETFLNPNRLWTGQFINISLARKEYLYELPLAACVPLESGVQYWLEVAQVGDVESRFRWENSNTLDGFAVQFPLGTPWRLSANPSQLAYDLWTPEPCSGALLALGLALKLRRGKR